MIDAHVQFDGTAWRVFRVLQPNLKCETPDHATCKAASQKLQDADDAAAADAKARASADQKAQVDAAAAAQTRDLYQERINAAGTLKWDALRVAGARKTIAINAAQDKAAKIIADANNARDLAVNQAQADLQAATDAAVAAHIAECRKIEATDWLAQLPDPDAALKDPSGDAASTSGADAQKPVGTPATGGDSAPAPSAGAGPAPAPAGDQGGK